MTQLADNPVGAPAAAPDRPWAIIGEYDDVTTLIKAARRFRDFGYTRWDVYSPFPIHGIDTAMGTRMTVLPWIVLACGLTGMFTGIALTVFTMATDTVNLPFLPGAGDLRGYKFLISGKPYDSFPAFVAVIFESTILLSAFGAVFGMFLLNKLPLLYNPLFKSARFKRATSDRFFIGVEARDARFDADEVTQLLKETGAQGVESIVD